MFSEDKAPLEPDLSLPFGTLDESVWSRILSDALAMPEAEIDASLVPEYDEAAEITLADDDDFGAIVLDDDFTDDNVDEQALDDDDSLVDESAPNNDLGHHAEDGFGDYGDTVDLGFDTVDPTTDITFDFE